jgi:tetratricopeptide (TPR) repeat protein
MMNRDRHDPREPNERPPVVPRAALEDVGDFNYDTDAFATALEYYQSALHGLGVETEFDPAAAARLHRKIADCYRSKGLVDEALAGLDRARELLRGSEHEAEGREFVNPIEPAVLRWMS